MRDHNINQGSSSSLVPIEIEVRTEARKSPLQSERHAIMILVNDLDLVPGFTNHEAAVRGPDMLNYAILAERKKDLFFILQGYARRSILVSGRLLIFALRGVPQLSIAACVQRGIPV